MLKNTQEAKFEKVLRPIARVALAAADQDKVAFDAFFTHILMHELMHGLGPHAIAVGARKTTVREELRDTYSAMEEAKADISGLWALQQLIDKGAIDRAMERTLYTTFLASAFRSIRFGTNDAHGRGQAIQLNDLLDRGAVRVAADGTFAVDTARIKAAVAALSREILTLEAEGSYAKARDLVDRMGVVRPEVQRVLDRLKEVPIDVEPRFVTAEALAPSPKARAAALPAAPEHHLRDLRARRRILAEPERVQGLVDEQGPRQVEPLAAERGELRTHPDDAAAGNRVGDDAGAAADAPLVGVVEEDVLEHVAPGVEAGRVQVRLEDLASLVTELREDAAALRTGESLRGVLDHRPHPPAVGLAPQADVRQGLGTRQEGSRGEERRRGAPEPLLPHAALPAVPSRSGGEDEEVPSPELGGALDFAPVGIGAP
jgi:hypothetical protein